MLRRPLESASPEVCRRHRVAQARHHEIPFRGWEVEGQKTKPKGSER